MKYLAYILLIQVSFVSFAQKHLTLAEKGNQFYELGQYKASLSYLSRLTFNIYDSAGCATLKNRASAYKKLRDVKHSLDDYKVFIKNCNTSKEDLIIYGQLLMSHFEYSNAKKVFEYIEQHYQDSTAHLYKLSCDSSLIWIDKTPTFKIRNIVEVNSSHEELSPKLLNDKMVFTSTMEGTIIRKKSIATNQPYYNIYCATINGQNFNKPKLFSSIINSNSHEVSVNFSLNGHEIFFTRLTMKDENASGNNTLRLMHSIKSGDYWSKPETFIYNSDTCSFAHPSVSNDGNMMFFTSDMKGGYGGLDLYVCIRQHKTWSTPINLGPRINTLYDETFPNYIGDSTLYFSSNGHPGMGGFDVYSSKKQNGLWSTPSNLKSPINSGQNELSYYEDRNSGRRFVSSDRQNGLGGLDIYEITKIR